MIADPTRTLTDEEIADAVAAVRTALADEHGAELRASAARPLHVLRAAGFAGQAGGARRFHPHFVLGTVTARSYAGRRLVDVTPSTGVGGLERARRRGDRARRLRRVRYPDAEASRARCDPYRPRRARRRRLGRPPAPQRGTLPRGHGSRTRARTCCPRPCTGCPNCTVTRSAARDWSPNPGCFPTAALLALLPVRDHVVHVVVDAKSGVSGGRAPTASVHFSSVTEQRDSVQGAHPPPRPEIAQEFGQEVLFTSHSVPADRGLLASCYGGSSATPRTRMIFSRRTGASMPCTRSWRLSTGRPGCTRSSATTSPRCS